MNAPTRRDALLWRLASLASPLDDAALTRAVDAVEAIAGGGAAPPPGGGDSGVAPLAKQTSLSIPVAALPSSPGLSEPYGENRQLVAGSVNALKDRIAARKQKRVKRDKEVRGGEGITKGDDSRGLCGLSEAGNDDARRSVAQTEFWRGWGRVTGVVDFLEGDPADAEGGLGKYEVQIRESANLYDPCGASLFHWCILQYMIGNGEAYNSIAKYLVEEMKVVDEGHGAMSDIVNQEYDESKYTSGGQYAVGVFLSPDGIGCYDGETALHIAAFLGNKDVCKWLLEHGANQYAAVRGSFFWPGRKWSRRAKARTYLGDYPFFFAVAGGNIEVAECLLKKATIPSQDPPRNPRDRWIWDYLNPDVMSDEGMLEKDVARRLLLRSRDTYGNTPFHMAVLHKKPEMYTWLLEQLNKCVENIPRELRMAEHSAIEHAVGAEALTVVSLAAVLGDNDMFNHVLRSMETIQWAFGKTACVSMPLDQIDTIPMSRDDKSNAHYNWAAFRLVYLWEIKRLALNDTLILVMDTKWLFVRWMYLISGIVHLTFMGILVWLAMEYAHVKTRSPREMTVTLEWLELVASCFCIAYLLTDAMDFKMGFAYVWDRDNAANQLGWLRAPVMMPGRRGLFATVPISPYDVLTWIGQGTFAAHVIGLLVNGLDGDSTSVTATLSVALMCFILSSLKYALCNEKLCMLVNIILSCVIHDFVRFVIIYTVCMLGFAFSLYILFHHRGDEEPDQDVTITWTQTAAANATVRHRRADTLRGAAGASVAANQDDDDGDESQSGTNWPDMWYGFDILLRRSFGDIGSDRYDWMGADQGNRTLGYMIMFCWTLLSLIVSLNLLIAMFAKTYDAMEEDSKANYRIARGRAILQFERRLIAVGQLACCPGCSKSIKKKLRVNHAPDPDDPATRIQRSTSPSSGMDNTAVDSPRTRYVLRAQLCLYHFFMFERVREEEEAEEEVDEQEVLRGVKKLLDKKLADTEGDAAGQDETAGKLPPPPLGPPPDSLRASPLAALPHGGTQSPNAGYYAPAGVAPRVVEHTYSDGHMEDDDHLRRGKYAGAMEEATLPCSAANRTAAAGPPPTGLTPQEPALLISEANRPAGAAAVDSLVEVHYAGEDGYSGWFAGRVVGHDPVRDTYDIAFDEDHSLAEGVPSLTIRYPPHTNTPFPHSPSALKGGILQS